jgi:DNA-binding transcriptional ArsR family regulator
MAERNRKQWKRRKGRMAKTISVSGPVDGALAKGLGHPLRAEILAYLAEHQIASPAEMARAGVGNEGKPDPEKSKLSNVSYHVRILVKLGLIEEVATQQIRGSIEHFYEARARMMLDLEEWSKLPPQIKNDVSVGAVEEAIRIANKALNAGTFDSFNERAVINLTLRLDEEGFIQLAEDVTDFMRHCEKREAEAQERVGDREDKLIFSSASLLFFESPPPQRPAMD